MTKKHTNKGEATTHIGRARSKKGKGFLTIDHKTGKVVEVNEARPVEIPRTVSLVLYNRSGNDSEIIAKLKHGGTPNSSVQFIEVSRKRFFEIADRISGNKDLVRQIVEEWRRQWLHLLKGELEPLPIRWPDPWTFQHLCDPDNEIDAAIISSGLRGKIVDQIVDQNAVSEDFEGLGSVKRDYLD